MEITNVASPAYANAEGTLIDCRVTFEGREEVPFSAAAHDTEAHGKALFAALVAGEWGPIAPYVEPPAPVPSSLSPLQARRALRQLGLKAAVDAYVATLGEEEQEEWEYAIEVQRTGPTINNGWALLGRSQAELDDLFRLGATL